VPQVVYKKDKGQVVDNSSATIKNLSLSTNAQVLSKPAARMVRTKGMKSARAAFNRITMM
jgi:hypothetical protein